MPQILKQFICLVNRFDFQHDFRVKCEPGRIFLRCSDCGKETSGWKMTRGKEAVGSTLKEAPGNTLARVREFVHSSLVRIGF